MSAARKPAKVGTPAGDDGQFEQRTVQLRPADVDRGRVAAELGSINASAALPAGVDRLSWMLGWCEVLERSAPTRQPVDAASVLPQDSGASQARHRVRELETALVRRTASTRYVIDLITATVGGARARLALSPEALCDARRLLDMALLEADQFHAQVLRELEGCGLVLDIQSDGDALEFEARMEAEYATIRDASARMAAGTEGWTT